MANSIESEGSVIESHIHPVGWEDVMPGAPLGVVGEILVVDADRGNLDSALDILGEEGYRIRTVKDGDSALRHVTEMEPDLVIVDVDMPTMDGLALLAELRLRCPKLQVVLTTANGSLETAVAGIKAGAFDYLGKPFAPDELRLVVRRAVEHTHAMADE